MRVLDFRVASPRRGLPDAGRAGAVGDFARPAVGIGEPAYRSDGPAVVGTAGAGLKC